MWRTARHLWRPHLLEGLWMEIFKVFINALQASAGDWRLTWTARARTKLRHSLFLRNDGVGDSRASLSLGSKSMHYMIIC